MAPVLSGEPGYFPVLCLGFAFGLSLLLTPIVRAAVLRSGWIGRPPGLPVTEPFVPAMGGAAFVAVFGATLPFLPSTLPPGYFIAAVAAALIGVADDLRPLSPSGKTGLLALAAAAGTAFGQTTAFFPWPWLDGLLTVAWLVWLANAANVTDVADGLMTGIGVVACLGMLVAGSLFAVEAVLLPGIVLSGGLLGFLFFNTHPARIYMGDTGSLFLGFALGGLGIAAVRALPSPNGPAALLLILGVPSFEALFLIAVRTLKARPPWRSSRDHPSQRLLAAGFSPEVSVRLLYGMGAVLSAAGIGMLFLPPALVAPGAVAVAALLAWAGMRLARVDMEGDGADGRPLSAFSRNWLVHRLMREAVAACAPLAKGRLLDIGCGRRPYAPCFGGRVSRYVGLERDAGRYAEAPPDVWGDALALPFADGRFDTVLCNQVLEHVSEPAQALAEAARVLSSGGRLILTAPHIWGLHEEPLDFYRFTPYGLRHVAECAGLRVERVDALGGYWVTAGARFCYYLSRFSRGPLKPLVATGFLLVQVTASVLDRAHRVEEDAWNHLLVARKP